MYYWEPNAYDKGCWNLIKKLEISSPNSTNQALKEMEVQIFTTPFTYIMLRSAIVHTYLGTKIWRYFSQNETGWAL